VAAPVSPPAAPWCTTVEVAATYQLDTSIDLTEECLAASEVLYRLSGRQFAAGPSTPMGPVTRRPLRQPCQHWLGLGIGLPYSWGAGYGGGWGWWNAIDDDHPRPSCGWISEIILPHKPIVEVTEVKISGVTLATSEYRLDEHDRIVRLNDANGNPQFWPACQNISAPDDAPGSFSVTYTYGQGPPMAGILAARALAANLYWLRTKNSLCRLPSGVTRVTRAGLTIERLLLDPKTFGKGRTGISEIDIFLGTYNPSGVSKPTRVWSPDLQQPARSTSQ
jgi:hypothetical protein